MEYVLPDGVHNLRGYARDPFSAPPRSRQADTALEQTLMLGNERFMPIEALFRPTDIGMHQVPHSCTSGTTPDPSDAGHQQPGA